MAVLKYLDVSTQHVKPETMARVHSAPHLIVAVGIGAFFYVPEDFDDDCPEDLRRVLKYAKLEDCAMVRIDADAPCIGDLPVYEQ